LGSTSEGGVQVSGSEFLDPSEVGPAWEVLEHDLHNDRWTLFYDRFNFRPGIDPAGWPAITEPTPSVTFDLSPVYDRSFAEFSAAEKAVSWVALMALVRLTAQSESLTVLDWHHPGYRFWPHRQALQHDAWWKVPVFPHGDYFIFLNEDMTTGTFGHPWERTLCVFGQALIDALAPMLAWMPVKRSRPAASDVPRLL
jgi:hypothetical protein